MAGQQIREREPAPSLGRLVFLDVLRVAIIAMVIAHHAAQAYGPTGGTWPLTDRSTSDWFRPFYTVNAAVGLGLLFLVAGYFVPRSYDRKGPGRFLRDRWMRIGVPLAFFALVVHVPVFYLIESQPPLGEFVRSLYAGGWFGVYLHLWFLGHLLLYSAVYVAWRRVSDRVDRVPRRWRPPGHPAILVFAVGLAAVTWVVRWWYSVDEWVPLFGVLAAEVAKLPQYVSLFVLGIAAYRGDWFRRIPTMVGAIWLAVGLLATLVMVAVQAFGRWDDVLATGGVDARSLLRSTLEAFICAGLSVGLVVLFRQVFHKPSRLLAALATASYAAYILHLWIVIGLQVAIEGLELPAFVKFGVVTVLGIVLAFGIGHLSGKVPGVRLLLGTGSPKVGKAMR
ncbi:hypothetical protein GCM10009841_03470 [Microlunatus panaciterrae]|uniref:Peptidoglycan/LPS O-acetylase OafA/YrhL n=1 Tax=Microlunatus panaciterrae TaxID=400768 RepID=A0ABS2RK05_9ACTN|nr:acyltransferase family protein [Microlunatus panaciterrae]MBM7798993.1 peptidoglycan/LPS O-acetylase OafA/YrhL [Microlunatus panaciterrae]